VRVDTVGDMGFFGDLRELGRAVFGSTPTTSTEYSAPTPRKRSLTVKDFARELFAEYPDGVPAEVFVARVDAAGLYGPDVDRAYDDLRHAAEERARVRVAKVDFAKLRVVDLTGLDSIRTRIRGSMYAITDAERRRYSGSDYLLIREPDNPADSNAVAVYGRGRRVGYVSTAKAAMLAPLLDGLDGDAFKVGGAGTGEVGNSRLWVDLPKVDALRAFVKSSRA
jgi:hypothetical protein